MAVGRRFRGLIGGAALLLCAADLIGLATLGRTSGDDPQAAHRLSDVPWIAARATDYGEPAQQVLPEDLPDFAPPCTPSQLQVTPLPSQGLAGSIIYAASLVNISSRTCSLEARPTSVAAVTPSGATTIVPSVSPGNDGNYLRVLSADVAPGQTGILEMNASVACNGAEGSGFRAHPASQLIIGLSTGGQLRVGPPADESVYELPCGVVINSLGVPARHDVFSPPAFDGVTAHLTITAKIRAGTEMSYVVSILNTTDHVMILNPCPIYTEQLESGSFYVHQAYRLNCATAGVLRPHVPVHFQMRLVVGGLPAGPATLSWRSSVSPQVLTDGLANEGGASATVTIVGKG